jgi:2'-5' RNA ligase
VIRAFIGIEIDPQTVRNISTALVQLKSHVPGVRWVDSANFHFTLKFLGNIDEPAIDSVARALELHLHLFPRFTINAKGLGVFPDLRRPRILWVGLAGKELATLVSKVETAVEPLGFTKEERTFKPHLTVGRWRQFDGSAKKLGEEIEKWKGHEFGQGLITTVIFFQSVLTQKGATYHPLKVVALAQ